MVPYESVATAAHVENNIASVSPTVIPKRPRKRSNNAVLTSLPPRVRGVAALRDGVGAVIVVMTASLAKSPTRITISISCSARRCDTQQTGKAARTAGTARDVPSRRLGVSPSMDGLIYDFERLSTANLCDACCPNRMAGA